MLHDPHLALVMEKVVVWNHGEKAAIHSGFGGGMVVIGGIGQGGAGGWAVVEGHLLLVEITAGGVGRQWRTIHLLHV